MVPAFRAFVRDMAEKRYDAFVVAVRWPAAAAAADDDDATGGAEDAGDDAAAAAVGAFGAVVLRVLTAISDADPTGRACMRKRYIHRSPSKMLQQIHFFQIERAASHAAAIRPRILIPVQCLYNFTV